MKNIFSYIFILLIGGLAVSCDNDSYNDDYLETAYAVLSDTITNKV